MATASQNTNGAINNPESQKINYLAQYQAAVLNQMNEEKAYLDLHQLCPLGVSESSVVQHLGELNPSEMKSELKDNFFNIEFMKAMSCISNSIVTYNGPHALSSIERIHNFIHGLTRIGAESVNGYALADDQDLFVIKSPKNPADASDLIHECCVAFMGLNPLRANVPNFAYVYGMLNCSPPMLNGKEVVSWCESNKSAVGYAIYELIDNAISMNNFCKTCTADEFVEYYLQAQLALREAVIYCGFTHYDCHTDNVMLRPYSDQEFYIQYNTSRGTEYIKSHKYVATFIDYGMSHIQANIDNKIVHFGNVSDNFEKYGIYRDKCCPLQDSYKLLCSCLNVLKFSNNLVYQKVKSLLYFFNKIESPEVILRTEQMSFYSLGSNFETDNNVKLDDWIEFFRNFIDEQHLTDPMHSAVNRSQILQCFDNCKLFDDIVFHDKIVANTLVEFYDILGSLKFNESKTPSAQTQLDIAHLVDDFSTKLSKAYDIERNILTNHIEKLNHIISKAGNLNYYHIPDDLQMLLELDINIFKQQTFDLIHFFQALNRINLSIKLFKNIIDTYPNDVNIGTYTAMYTYLINGVNTCTLAKTGRVSLVNELKELIMQSIYTLADIKAKNQDPKLLYLFTSDKYLLWYYNVFPNIQALF